MVDKKIKFWKWEWLLLQLTFRNIYIVTSSSTWSHNWNCFERITLSGNLQRHITQRTMNESQTQIKFTYHHMNSACGGTKYSSTWIKGVPSFFNGCFLLNGWQSQQIHTYSFVPTGLHALPTPNDDIFDKFIVTLIHTSICMYPSHFICCFLTLI